MDTPPDAELSAPLSVSGWGTCIVSAEAVPWLKSRKMLKFMGKQDQLAVVAAGRAVRQAGLDEACLKERTGIYLAVGHIPFERADVEPLAQGSIDDGRFSMDRFSSTGIEQVNPLLTFRCLPNMPIFHVSLNLGIEGPYFISYPGLAQFYQALEEAAWALREGQIDVALVGGVADQNNFLVDYHFQRSQPDGPPRADVAAFLCLERPCRIVPRLSYCSSRIEYGAERASSDGPFGPASLAVHLAQLLESETAPAAFTCEATTVDGFHATSQWRLH